MTVNDVATYLVGQNGGINGLMFGLGAAAGWSFCSRTVLKIVQKQIEEMEHEHRRDRDDCKAEIAALKLEAQDMRYQYTEGLKRQLAAVRDGAERMTGRIEDGKLKPMDEL